MPWIVSVLVMPKHRLDCAMVAATLADGRYAWMLHRRTSFLLLSSDTAARPCWSPPRGLAREEWSSRHQVTRVTMRRKRRSNPNADLGARGAMRETSH